MIKSMTGYGRSEGRENDIQYLVEIRSVNNKYCDISTRLSKSLLPIENKIKKIIQKKISRGKIEVNISVNGSNNHPKDLVLDKKIAKDYFRILGELKKDLNLKGEIDISTFIQFPNIITIPEFEKEQEVIEKGIDKFLIKAINNIEEMRINEGKTLLKDLLKRLVKIMKFIEKIEKRSPEVSQSYKKRLKMRVEEFSDKNIENSRLMQEVAIYADRSDISEEIVRFKSHASQFENLFSKNEPVGRSLDFILQEMNREVNTIGSKANDFIISTNVVSIKGELEKIREQVQNIE